MFGVDSSELLIVAIVALVVIGPKDLPRVMRTVGQWVGKARGVGRHFRSGIDAMIRESELEEMQKKWAAENERIMREFPMVPPPPPPVPGTPPSLVKEGHAASLVETAQATPAGVAPPSGAPSLTKPTPKANPKPGPVHGPAAALARARPAPRPPRRELP